MKAIKLHRHTFSRHAITWLLITIYVVIFDSREYQGKAYAACVALNMLTYMGAWYFIAYLLFPGLWEKSKLFATAYIILLFVVFGCVMYLNNMVFRYILANTTSEESFSLMSYFQHMIPYFAIIVVSAYSFYRSKLILNKKKYEKEKDRVLLAQELSFYQNQFSSHVTFNFLTYCYNGIYHNSPKAARGIELYSDLLRFSMIADADQRVMLKSEIEYIENFIQLKKILNKTVYADLKVKQEWGHAYYIYPRILITFVENAFKHGLSDQKNHPVVIHLQACKKQIKFYIKNKLKDTPSRVGTGTGLQNVTESLELHYAGRYKLSTRNDDSSYEVELILNES